MMPNMEVNKLHRWDICYFTSILEIFLDTLQGGKPKGCRVLGACSGSKELDLSFEFWEASLEPD